MKPLGMCLDERVPGNCGVSWAWAAHPEVWCKVAFSCYGAFNGPGGWKVCSPWPG